jgi:hypothetical protein
MDGDRPPTSPLLKRSDRRIWCIRKHSHAASGGGQLTGSACRGRPRGVSGLPRADRVGSPHPKGNLPGAGLPRSVCLTVGAPGFCDQIRVVASGGRQSLAVSQSFPRPRGFELCPSAVVLMITFVEAPGKVGHPLRRDQQEPCICARRSAALSQAVLAVAEVHVAQLALSHASHHPRR